MSLRLTRSEAHLVDLPPDSPAVTAQDAQSPPLIAPENHEQDDSEVEATEVDSAESVDSEPEEYVTTAGRPRKFGDEDPQNPSWAKHKKHFFILSSSGKPVYTKYGNEDRLSTFMGIVQAMVSFVFHEKDTLRCIVAGEHRIVFLLKGPIYLVAVARTGEPEQLLRDQLFYLWRHLVSVLTQQQITKIFQQRINYDLRTLLSSSDNSLMDSLTHRMDRDPSLLLGTIACLRLSPAARATISNALQTARGPDTLYAMLIYKNRLVNLVRQQRQSLHPSDLHLLFNMMDSSTSFRNVPESWTPICLPKFNPKGFVYAHVSFLEQVEDVCMLLVSVSREAFFQLSEARRRIVDLLQESGVFEELRTATARHEYSVSELGIPGLRHFLYSSKLTAQFTAPMWEPPYASRKEQKRLFRLYQHSHARAAMRTRQRKVYFMAGQHEIVMAWNTSGFELYTTFAPLFTKENAINALNSLLRWIKREEQNLFILNSQVF